MERDSLLPFVDVEGWWKHLLCSIPSYLSFWRLLAMILDEMKVEIKQESRSAGINRA